MTMSTPPVANPAKIAFSSLLVRKRLSERIVNGNSAMRAVNVRKCCSAKIVVGTSTAT